MITNQKQLNLLGLANRAKLLTTGQSSVLSDVRGKKATLVIVSTDCSQGTKKKVLDKCQYYGVPAIVTLSSIDISHAIGKKRSIVAFIDQGFASSFQKLLL